MSLDNIEMKAEQASLTQKNKELYLHITEIEYEKLKEEQTKRIVFRDTSGNINILVAFGSIISFIMSNDDVMRSYVLLAFPIVCFILGWAYVVNDQKISAIGKYIRTNLERRLQGLLDINANTTPEWEIPILGWEIAHRNDSSKKARKLFQLIVDEILFCLSGFIALAFFWHITIEISLLIQIIWWIEAILLFLLGCWIYYYAVIAK